MTPETLRRRIESTCKKNLEIVDIKFYRDEKGKKPLQLVVVVYIIRYSALSDEMDTWSGNSVEKAILRFIDPNQLKAINDENNS